MMNCINKTEQEILNLMLTGLNYTKIAKILNKEKYLINIHIHNLYLKFNCKNKKELIKIYKSQLK